MENKYDDNGIVKCTLLLRTPVASFGDYAYAIIVN